MSAPRSRSADQGGAISAPIAFAAGRASLQVYFQQTLTDANLSETYDMDLAVNRIDGRWTARSNSRG